MGLKIIEVRFCPLVFDGTGAIRRARPRRRSLWTGFSILLLSEFWAAKNLHFEVARLGLVHPYRYLVWPFSEFPGGGKEGPSDETVFLEKEKRPCELVFVRKKVAHMRFRYTIHKHTYPTVEDKKSSDSYSLRRWPATLALTCLCTKFHFHHSVHKSRTFTPCLRELPQFSRAHGPSQLELPQAVGCAVWRVRGKLYGS